MITPVDILPTTRATGDRRKCERCGDKSKADKESCNLFGCPYHEEDGPCWDWPLL